MRSDSISRIGDILADGRPGTAHFFLWAGDHGAIPVYLSSCAKSPDPVQVKDYGLSACALTDGGIDRRVVAPMLVDAYLRTGDLTHAEVAVAMGTSEEAARRNAFEGLRKLRQEMTA